MIDGDLRELVTEEFGFTVECVVEVFCSYPNDRTNVVQKDERLGYFKEVNKYEDIVLRTYDDDGAEHEGIFDQYWIDSIRPLTGPMAIWNFAPKEAIAISDFTWIFNKADFYKFDNAILRPWWAKEIS
jgi:hypothetical protein